MQFKVGIVVVLLLAGCLARDVADMDKVVEGGDAERGRQAIMEYGCGACHLIPNVVGADALVGPPLNQFEERHYIAGTLPNTAENLVYWIRFPQSIEPGTAMPNLNISEAVARDIAAFLYEQE